MVLPTSFSEKLRVSSPAGLPSKPRGVTRSEQYLGYLCERTFLSLWSYPNVHRDQGKASLGIGKELCDLLVIFDDHVIIFSDKSCVFPDIDDVTLAWKRWFKRAVWKSAGQIRGAERWIREYPERVFLDPACGHRLPVPLPTANPLKVHRVVVAVGATKACRHYFGGGSGSLMLAPSIVGKQHFQGDSVEPFVVGQVLTDGPYVHVFDDVALEVVLGELDTVTDFVAYLSRKEEFVASGKLYRAAGEEDLLGFYLRDVGPDGHHDFVLPRDTSVAAVDEGLYAHLRSQPEYIAGKLADRDSLLWDRLIEHFSQHVFEGDVGVLIPRFHGRRGGSTRHGPGVSPGPPRSQPPDQSENRSDRPRGVWRLGTSAIER